MKCNKIPRKLKKALRRITQEIYPTTYTGISLDYHRILITETLIYKVKGSCTKIINKAISKLIAERERVYKRMNEKMYERCNKGC